MFVTVMVPVYNGGWCLERCLTAIRNSTYRHYELMVVDNGSTDNSAAIARRFDATVVDCPGPSGPGAARNAGSKLAKGHVLFFVDADVVVHPDALARVAARFEQESDLGAMFGSYDDHPAAQNFVSQYKNLMHHFVHQQANPEAQTFWAGCGAVRKDVFDTVGGFDERRYPTPSIEDIELGYRLHSRGYRIYVDKQLQGTHLKEWRLVSLMRTEILHRAAPWSRLILERQGLVNDLNLKHSQRASAGVAGLLVGILPFTAVHPTLLYAALTLVVLFIVLNRDIFGFFLRRKGVLFSAMAVPLHALYFIYSATTFVAVWAVHQLRAR